LWGDSALDDGLWQQTFLGQYAVRLGGGTDEIQGNVIGERALGLPREPAADRDLPWRETRGSTR
jgi:acyl-CoA dehydrogenase